MRAAGQDYLTVDEANGRANGSGSGIWQGGDSIVTDSQGNFYFMTGNGSIISYSKGINGVMVDITNLPASLTAEDFSFAIGKCAM